MKYKGITVENEFNKSYCRDMINNIIKRNYQDDFFNEYFFYSKKRKQGLLATYVGETKVLTIENIFPKIKKYNIDKKVVEDGCYMTKAVADYLYTTAPKPEWDELITLTDLNGKEIELEIWVLNGGAIWDIMGWEVMEIY